MGVRVLLQNITGTYSAKKRLLSFLLSNTRTASLKRSMNWGFSFSNYNHSLAKHTEFTCLVTSFSQSIDSSPDSSLLSSTRRKRKILVPQVWAGNTFNIYPHLYGSAP